MSRGYFRSGPSGTQLSTDPIGISTFPLPSALRGDYSWISRGSICTWGDYQYVGWIDDNRRPRLARRVWRQAWSAGVDLSTVTATAFVAQFTLDSHCTIAVGIDSAGQVHVAGNMLTSALQYMRTNNPHDITGAWTAGAMVGTEEDQITYPQFIRAKSGTLYFWYRRVSGTNARNHYINKWNVTTQAWTRHVHFFDGVGEDVNIYPTSIAVDYTTGRWHVLYTVRTDFTSDAFNENFYAAYSDDEGATWKKYSDDSSFTLPLTQATSELIHAHAGGATETIGNPHLGSIAIDTSGNPHAVWLVADSGGIDRYRHIWHDGAAWHYDTLLPTINAASRRPDIVCFADGRKWMIYNTPGSGSTLKRLDIDSGVVAELRAVDMLVYEPALEYSHERDAVYIVAPYERQSGVIGGEPADIAAQLNVPVLAIR